MSTLFNRLTAERIANPSCSILEEAKHLHLPNYYCFTVGQYKENGPKYIEVFRILFQIQLRSDTSVLYIEWKLFPWEPPVYFWVKTGMILKRDLFGFIGKTSFKRSTFVLFQDQLIRLHFIVNLEIPEYTPRMEELPSLFVFRPQLEYTPLQETEFPVPWRQWKRKRQKEEWRNHHIPKHIQRQLFFLKQSLQQTPHSLAWAIEALEEEEEED